MVETFDLEGHDSAKRCYAFPFADTDGVPTVKIIISVPPVESPHRAVQVAIAERARRK